MEPYLPNTNFIDICRGARTAETNSLQDAGLLCIYLSIYLLTPAPSRNPRERDEVIVKPRAKFLLLMILPPPKEMSVVPPFQFYL